MFPACTFDYSFFSYLADRAAEEFERRKHWRQFLARKDRSRYIPPNPLRLIMRAVNSVMLRAPIKLPSWRRGRWKSLA